MSDVCWGLAVNFLQIRGDDCVPNVSPPEHLFFKRCIRILWSYSLHTDKETGGFYIPHPHLGVRCNKARGSLLVSAAPPPRNVRRWIPALHVEIPTAIYQQIKKKKKKMKQASATSLKENTLFFHTKHPHLLLS